jgi:hypothetical protein
LGGFGKEFLPPVCTAFCIQYYFSIAVKHY